MALVGRPNVYRRAFNTAMYYGPSVYDSYRRARRFHSSHVRPIVRSLKRKFSGVSTRKGKRAKYSNARKRRIGNNAPTKGFARYRTRLVAGRRKRVKNSASGKITYRQVQLGAISGDAGFQGVADLCYVGSYDCFFTSSGAGYQYFQNFRSLFNMQPNSDTTGGPVLPAGVNPQDNKFVLRGYLFDVEFTNFANVDTLLDLYVFRCKRDTQSSILTTWNDGYSNDGLGSAALAVFGPGRLSGSAAIGYNTRDIPTAKPTDVDKVKSTWTLLKKNTYTLNAGSSAKGKIWIDVNRIISEEQLNLTGSVWMPGHTIGMIAVTRGQLVQDSTDTTAYPTYAGTKVGYVVHTTTYMHATKDGNDNLDYKQIYYNIPTQATPANQDFINVEDDADVNVSV